MNIEGIPDSIEWVKVAEFLESLGIRLDDLHRDGIHIGWDAITCKVYARNADGNLYLSIDDVAMHEISIPVSHAADRVTAD